MLLTPQEIRREMTAERREDYDDRRRTAGDVLKEWERDYIQALLAGELTL